MRLINIFLGVIFFSLLADRLIGCDYSFHPWLSPSLVDPQMISEPLFQFQDRLNLGAAPIFGDVGNATLVEWQDYFTAKKIGEIPIDQLESEIQNASTDDPDANDYLNYLNNLSGDSTSNPGDYQKAVQKSLDHKLSGFLRAKYAYHAVRMAVLAEKWDVGIANYNKLFAPLGVTSLVRYEAMGWWARALDNSHQDGKAVSIYAEMFDQCPAMRDEARHSLYIVDDGGTQMGALADQFKPGHRKITALYLKHLLGGRDYSASTLSEVTEEGPREIQVEMMFLQMVQDIEKDYFVSECPNLLGETDIVLPKNKFLKFLVKQAYQKPGFADLVPVCEKAAANPKIRRPAFWRWGASYLALLSGDIKSARLNLNQAMALGAKDPSLVHVLHLQETLVEMAEKPLTFSPAIQDRFCQDLDWAKSQIQDPAAKKLPDNPNLKDTLWALAIQKYIYMGDWPRACLLASAVAPPPYTSTDQIDLSLFLDFATPQELSKLKTFLEVKNSSSLKRLFSGSGHLTSLETLALSETPLVPKDIDLLLALRKANELDFAGALSDIQNLTAKDPSFLETEVRPVTQVYASGAVTVYQDCSIPVKQISFGHDLKGITGDAQTWNLDLMHYLKLMNKLFADLEQGRNGDKALEAKSAFEIGQIFASEGMTGWPEFRSALGYVDGEAYLVHTESCPLYLMGAPLDAERKKRLEKFNKDTPDFREIASQYFQEVVDTKADKELSAQSLAYLMGLHYGRGHEVYLKSLKEDYQATAFYQRYKDICSLLRY